MKRPTRLHALLAALCLILPAGTAQADDLFRNSRFAGMAHDLKAGAIGDSLTVLVIENAEARNSSSQASRRGGSIDGGLNTSAQIDFGELSLGGEYGRQGEVRRSDSLVAQISVVIEDILPNGDFRIQGEQSLLVNGKQTVISIRGRVRPSDVSASNEVLSYRISEAEIHYDGEGFDQDADAPGPIRSFFRRLGLG
ncbi:flagellar basal body L-ring protein FlgH [Maricaulis sp. D1M11]|uniref:flagellar basal body L-ring protein FlgH n=1 Tax=Maricaulis sp. D1M11 TaxID=3076117 RepID=UPI0039B6462C